METSQWKRNLKKCSPTQLLIYLNDKPRSQKEGGLVVVEGWSLEKGWILELILIHVLILWQWPENDTALKVHN